jgi:regulator of sigma D
MQRRRNTRAICPNRISPVSSTVIANYRSCLPRQEYDHSLDELVEENLSSLSSINISYKENNSAMNSIYKLNEKFLEDVFITIRLGELPNSIAVYYDPSMLKTSEREFLIILHRTLKHFGTIIPPKYNNCFKSDTIPDFSEQEWNILLYLIGIRSRPSSYYCLSLTCKTFITLVGQHVSKAAFWKNGLEYIYNVTLDIHITTNWSALYGIFSKMPPENAVSVYGYNEDITNVALHLGMDPLDTNYNRRIIGTTCFIDRDVDQDKNMDHFEFEESIGIRILNMFSDEKCNNISKMIINHPKIDKSILCELLYNYIHSGNIEIVDNIVKKIHDIDILKLKQEKILECAYYSTLTMYKYISEIFNIDQSNIRRNINHFMDLLFQNDIEFITPDILNFYDIRFEDCIKYHNRLSGINSHLILIEIILNDISKGKIIDISVLDINTSWNICNEIFIRNLNLKGIIYGNYPNPNILYTDRHTPYIVNADPMKSIPWRI